MSAIAKRCSIAAVLAIAMLLPQAAELKTSEAGLRLIADLEGCQLSPYQCSAGIWTQGIGHTAGVVPGAIINEHRAAADLVADARRTERGMAACLPPNLPQETYDAIIAFAFNVGVKAACGSTLVYFLRQHQWRQACDQLPRWVYVKGKTNKGLERRRATERALCLKGIEAT
ncbi:lysozyme [Serratia ficaria]|uniref:lysozyme n=1 Tax=Serratia ficaria TaxID=61651 RepID=UPI00217B94B7|nr:lysozyme [Serratia ficaria]CAI2075377.1 Phage-related lysozyme (muraminidase) [Serratia ficaria]